MPNSIDEALVSEFSDMVHVYGEQMKSRLRDKVTVKKVKGRDFSHNTFEGGEAHEIVSRYQKKQQANSQHTVRWGTMRHFVWNELLADYDQLATLIDPMSGYAEAAARSLYRQQDRIIIGALGATVVTGRDKDGSLSASADGVITVAADGVGYTYDKVKTVIKNFTNNEVNTDIPTKLHTLVTGDQEEDFFEEDELTGRDYNSKMYVENGRVKSVMGMGVELFGNSIDNPMLASSGGVRDCWAMADGAVVLGVQQNLTMSIHQRYDLDGDPWEVSAKLYIGGLRANGILAQKVQCAE